MYNKNALELLTDFKMYSTIIMYKEEGSKWVIIISALALKNYEKIEDLAWSN